jgi:rRNA processing protein Gar1
VEVKFPDKPTFLPSAALHLVGRVVLTVGELLIVESAGGSFVVDLDNWLSDELKGLIGFVIDVMGKVEKPYYVVRPEVVTSI